MKREREYAVIVIPADAVEGLIEFLDEHEVFDDVVDALLEVTETFVDDNSGGFSSVSIEDMLLWEDEGRQDTSLLHSGDDYLLHFKERGGGYDGYMPTVGDHWRMGGEWFYTAVEGREELEEGQFLYRTETQTLLQLGATEEIRERQIRLLISGVRG